MVFLLLVVVLCEASIENVDEEVKKIQIADKFSGPI